jgi:hypothetical protein
MYVNETRTCKLNDHTGLWISEDATLSEWNFIAPVMKQPSELVLQIFRPVCDNYLIPTGRPSKYTISSFTKCFFSKQVTRIKQCVQQMKSKFTGRLTNAGQTKCFVQSATLVFP